MCRKTVLHNFRHIETKELIPHESRLEWQLSEFEESRQEWKEVDP